MTTYADGLRLSGLVGLAVGFLGATIHFVLEDPVLLGGVRSAPEALGLAALAVLAGSLVVLSYAGLVSRHFSGWIDVVTGAAILAQWGLPFALLADGVRGIGVLPGLFVIVCSMLHAVVAVAVTAKHAMALWNQPVPPHEERTSGGE